MAALGSDTTHRPGRVIGDSAIQQFRRDQGVKHAPVEEPASDDDDAEMPEKDDPAPITPAPGAVAPAQPKVAMSRRLQYIEEQQIRMERCYRRMERDLADVKQDYATVKEEVQCGFTEMRREFSGFSHFLHMLGVKVGVFL